MTTPEKLERIKAKCQQLLAIAEKRFKGRWDSGYNEVWANTKDESQFNICEFVEPEDAAFIAACAGPAEAGWRATIAAIETCRAYDSEALSIQAKSIIAAWSEELL